MQIRWKGPAMVYGGKTRRAGDEFSIATGYGRVFIALGRASVVTPSGGPGARETRVMQPVAPPVAAQQPELMPIDGGRGLTDADDEPMTFGGGEPETSDRAIVGRVQVAQEPQQGGPKTGKA
jgi:hypothetical protein